MSESAQVIRVRFLEDEDYFLQAWANSPFRGESRQWFTLTLGVIASLGVSTFLAVRDFRKGDALWWIAFPIGFVVCGLVLYWHGPAAQRRQVRAAYRKQTKGIPAQVWFEFGDEGFISAGKDGRSSFHPWPTVLRVVEAVSGLAIVFDQTAYFWIPKSAFENPSGYDKLAQRIRSKVTDFRQLSS